jgi:hypothetical protein
VKDREWDRAAAIERLRDDVWRHITPAARDDDEVLLNAATLLQMPVAQVRFLAQLRFILSEPVGQLVEQLPFLVRRLTTTTVNELEVSVERVRGVIRWGETFAYRAATGLPHAFVSAPSRRAFDTPENQVLAFALRAIAEFGAQTGWHDAGATGLAGQVRERVAEATRWRQSRALAELEAGLPSPTALARVRSGRARRRYQAALDVIDVYQRYIARLDREALREAIEERALVVSDDPTLLELECAFGAIRALREQGWQGGPDALLGRGSSLIFRGRRGPARIDVHYQSAPPELARDSRYVGVQRAHQFGSSGVLRPDLVLRIDAADDVRWLLVEVKKRVAGVADAARAATLDLLGYRRAYEAVLGRQPEPYGIGYAWGEALIAAPDSEIALCTPDTFAATLADALSRLGA